MYTRMVLVCDLLTSVDLANWVIWFKILSLPQTFPEGICTKFHQNWPRNFGSIMSMRFGKQLFDLCDGRTDRQMDRQMGRENDRQRQADRQTEIDRQAETDR